MGGFRPAPGRATAACLRATCGVVVLVVLLARDASRAEAWIAALAGEVSVGGEAPALARDPAGNLLAAAAGGAAKYDGASGALLWHVDASDDEGPADRAIVPDARGDAVVRSAR